MNLKKKIYPYAKSTTQRCSKVIMQIFLIEDFFHLPSVSTTLVVHLELQMSPRIFEQIRNGPSGIIRDWETSSSYLFISPKRRAYIFRDFLLYDEIFTSIQDDNKNSGEYYED